jgi:ribulose-phosphate 3-epimerase
VKHIKLAPSILSADFARLGDQVREAEAAGADIISIDVMDGQFVPNISVGPLIVEALRPVTSLPLEVHLMVREPDHLFRAFADAGASMLQVHIEACTHIHRSLQAIRDLGLQAGIVLNPGTPASAIDAVLGDVDMVTVMTVNPGFGGQRFITSQLPKIRQIRSMLDAIGSAADLEIDGGVKTDTAPLCVEAGATVLVAGSSVFNRQQSVADSIRALRAAIDQVPAGQEARA